MMSKSIRSRPAVSFASISLFAALAIGVALVTGFAFGLYPALRVSRLYPIEALRCE